MQELQTVMDNVTQQAQQRRQSEVPRADKAPQPESVRIVDDRVVAAVLSRVEGGEVANDTNTSANQQINIVSLDQTTSLTVPIHNPSAPPGISTQSKKVKCRSKTRTTWWPSRLLQLQPTSRSSRGKQHQANNTSRIRNKHLRYLDT